MIEGFSLVNILRLKIVIYCSIYYIVVLSLVNCMRIWVPSVFRR
jgi:hypothetical protein